VEQLRNTQAIPPALLQDYQKLLSSNPARRLNPAQVAESKFLNNRLVKVVAFMENISGGRPGRAPPRRRLLRRGGGAVPAWPPALQKPPRSPTRQPNAPVRLLHPSPSLPPPAPAGMRAVKDGAEKDAFFKRLPSLLPAIPAAVAARKILPLLANALEFGGAPASAVGSLLQIGRPLPGEEFQRRVVPGLARLFASPDRALRRNLLEAVDVWGPHVTQVTGGDARRAARGTPADERNTPRVGGIAWRPQAPSFGPGLPRPPAARVPSPN
jgi:hypothetical protein